MRTVSILSLLNLCDSHLHGEEHDYATCNLSATLLLTVFELWSFVWTTVNSVSCFLVFTRSRLKRQLQFVTFPFWSRYVSLMISAKSCFSGFGRDICARFNVLCDEKRSTKGWHHPRWDERVIKSLSDEGSIDPNSEWSQYATRKDRGVSRHTFTARAIRRS